MSKTSVKIIKNEIRCRDDTVPKTVDTRNHCKVWLQQYLAVASCIYSFWHGVIPTSYFIFNDFYTCVTSVDHIVAVFFDLPCLDLYE